MPVSPSVGECGIAYLAGHRPDRHPWLEINNTLNRDTRSLLNERRIARRIEDALRLHTDDQRLLWLTLARIAEVAIVQAGVYADGCEFQAAGDLLVNPRRIDVYLKGRLRPIVKRRHTRLSDQFEAEIGQESPVCWLTREATPRLTTDAILPWLSRMLALSGAMARDYMHSLNRRMAQVADTMAFLIAWRVDDAGEFHQRIRSMDLRGQAFIESNLCRFDYGRFVAMYTDIQDILYTDRCSTRFLA